MGGWVTCRLPAKCASSIEFDVSSSSSRGLQIIYTYIHTIYSRIVPPIRILMARLFARYLFTSWLGLWLYRTKWSKFNKPHHWLLYGRLPPLERSTVSFMLNKIGNRPRNHFLGSTNHQRLAFSMNCEWGGDSLSLLGKRAFIFGQLADMVAHSQNWLR